ncbi:MAG: diaminopimelate decarboxylase [Desulfobacterales bacterium]|nr:diaminopimelate decarboxylase [Desulfobacterales bacterium]
MHHFNYQNGELFCEEVPVKVIAEEVGTPFYLYSYATLKRHFLVFSKEFERIKHIVCYSAKANSNLAVLKTFVNLGSGLDIVSGGELHKGLEAGFPAEKIVYSGVGKRVDEIDFALKKGILMFNIESMEELTLINQRAGFFDQRASVSIRVNPNIDPKTHPYISTGLQKNKFGIDMDAALEAYRVANNMENIDVIGIGCHIGSQITEIIPFREAINSLKTLAKKLEEEGILLQYIDIGGGLGIIYDDETPVDLSEYAKNIIEAVIGTDYTLILEPGRVLVGNAGILITKTLYRKSGKVKEFIVIDAGMNDLLRPALYDAFHVIQPVDQTDDPMIVADVVGPICESSDFIAQDRYMPNVKQGQLLAVMSAGAYSFVMSSNYCSRPRIAEVMVKDDTFHVVKERESYMDLISGESIPLFL